MHLDTTPRSRGFAFVELMFGTVLIVVCSILLVGHLVVRYRGTIEHRERVFAWTSARSILAEVHAWVEQGKDVTALDDGDDQPTSLSIAATDATEAGVGGNLRHGDAWLWRRQVRVGRLPGAGRHLHSVTVRVAKSLGSDEPEVLATLSTVVQGHRTGYPATRVVDLFLIAVENIPARGVDLESVRPSLEATLAELEQANPGLEFRTHWITKASYGRDVRYTPEVAASSLGRAVYLYPTAPTAATPTAATPTAATPTAATPADATPADARPALTYTAGRMKAQVRVDGAVRHGFDPDHNPLPYALADRFNHAMRLPAEREFHAARVHQVRERKAAILAARASGAAEPPPLDDMSEEPTLRLLLEDLHAVPQEYHRAVIVNLHGGYLPMPAIRNYSDAARDPVALPGLRCVTHAEELRTRRDPAGLEADAAVFRVYAYTERPDDYAGDGVVPSGHAITLRVEGLDLCDPEHQGRLRPGTRLENLYGGVPVTLVGTQAPTYDYRPMQRAKDIYQPRGSDEMFYFAEFVDPGFGEEKFTLIWLFHTPVISPSVRNSGTWLANSWCEPLQPEGGTPTPTPSSAPMRALPTVQATAAELIRSSDRSRGLVQGLANDPRARPYQLEYVPSPTGARADFSHDLAAVGDGPKNTARWRLTIPGTVFREARFVRRDGTRHDPAADVCLQVTTAFRRLGGPAPVARAEQVARAAPAARAARAVSTTYTWWAARADAVPLTERAQFLGDPRHNPYRDLAVGDPDFGDSDFGGCSGWIAGCRVDVQRYLALLRTGLLRSGAVFANPGGFGAVQVMLGGELDDDRTDRVRQGGPAHQARSWYAKPWLGELCPDAMQASHWVTGPTAGNLPRGRGRREFHREQGVAVDRGSGSGSSHQPAVGPAGGGRLDLKAWGWQPFFAGAADSATLGVDGPPGAGRLTERGRQLDETYRAALPAQLSLSRTMVWRAAGTQTLEIPAAPQVQHSRTLIPGASPGPESAGSGPWSSAPPVRWRVLHTYLTGATRGSDGVASGDGAASGFGAALLAVEGGGESARVVVHGIADADAESRLRLVLLAAVEGVSSASGCRDLPPQVVLAPLANTDRILAPSTMQLRWKTRAAGSLVSRADLRFGVLYSSDAGATWRYAQDGEPAVVGAHHPERYCVRDAAAGTGTTELVMAMPAARFVGGPLLVRVEAWRDGYGQHYSYHMREVELRR